MVQILLKWDKDSEFDSKIIEWIKKQIHKIGGWRQELPPAGSIYTEVIVIDRSDMENEKR